MTRSVKPAGNTAHQASGAATAASRKKSPPTPKRSPRSAARATKTALLEKRVGKLESLLDVAKAMTAERDLDALLRMILHEAVRVVDADRCTLWIVDREHRELWTKVAQGLEDGERIRVPLGVGICGRVAATGSVINIPDAYADTRFNRQVDKDTGYRTHNMLGVPMRYTTGEVTGVLQALNKRGGPFTTEDEELLMALGSNAAAAIENAILYEEIDRLFEGFVKASVVAIESRDPTTSGHSERVAVLTLGIATSVERVTSGPYAELHFTTEQLRELRYAALLHDFGKVGVRENVLTKAEKLAQGELTLIEARFDALAAQRENQHLRSVIAALQNGTALPADSEASFERELGLLGDWLELIRRCNQPTVLAEGSFERLREIAGLVYSNRQHEPTPVVSAEALACLAIPRGSLNAQERSEIESHVAHTFRFLSQIPWTRALRGVPQIAHAHHETLDGAGYPRRLVAADIPVQSRMMSIADIYDALTASDRPYKKAVPHELALDILTSDAKKGRLDADLLEIFIGAKVFERLPSRAAG